MYFCYMSQSNIPFKDLVVIELATVLAGPAVGMFFSELGARVIKIESTKGGDVTRSWKLTSEDKQAKDSAYFHSTNYIKEHRFLNLEEEEALEELYALIKTADIVISNFKRSSSNRLKLDYTSLKAINPSIIYAELIAFEEGSKKIGYDAVMQAETGFLSMSGTKEGELVKMPVALIDLMAAHQLKEAILIGLLKKLKSGKGSYIEVSLIDAGIASLANQASNFLNAGHIAKPMGTLHPNIAPYGELFTLKNGNRIILSIGSDAQYERLIKALDIPFDAAFRTNVDRLENRDRLFKKLSSKIAKHTLAELQDLFEANNIPYGHLKNMKQVMEYAREKNLVLDSEHEGKKVSCVKTAIFKFKA